LLSRIIISVFILVLFIFQGFAEADCKSSVFNPISEICWQCVFPVRIGGMAKIGSSPDLNDFDNIKSPVCVCNRIFGLNVSFWEPARLVETVKDPYCFNVIGAEVSAGSEGLLSGGYNQDKTNPMVFQQSHWYMFPIWGILDIFIDMPCFEMGGIDVGYITEIDPTWNNDVLAFIINPEAILFANPYTKLACISDSISSTAGLSLSPMFWCMGSWGSAYPLSGHLSSDTFISGNAGIAARMIYKMSREMALWDTALNECGPVMMPIWIKNHYRIHTMKPVRDYTCHPIGRAGLLWSSMKNPPGGASGNAADNFDWMIFRKKLCCAGYTF